MRVRFLLALVLIALASSAKSKKRSGKKKSSPPPSKPDATTMVAMRHHQRGVMAHVQGDRNGAKKAFRAAIAVKPDFAYAYYRLGFVVHEQAQILRGSGKKAAAAEDPRAAYLDSCRDLAGAIGSLEAALVSFTGKEDGVKGQVFAKTRSRLEKELSESSSMIAAPPAQPRQA